MTAWQERLRPGWTYGLRWKIVLTVAGVACAVAAILGVLVHNVLTRQRVDEVRKEARGAWTPRSRSTRTAPRPPTGTAPSSTRSNSRAR